MNIQTRVLKPVKLLKCIMLFSCIGFVYPLLADEPKASGVLSSSSSTSSNSDNQNQTEVNDKADTDKTAITAPKIKFSKINDTDKQQITEIINTELALSKKTVNQIELVKIAEKFATALMTKNRTQFYETLDKEAIVVKSIKGSIQKLGDLKPIREKIIRGIINIPDTLIAKIGTLGHIKYLRLVKRQDSYRGLLRIKYHSGEITYLELITNKDKDGMVKIIDFYDPMLGRLYTTIVSQMLITPIDKKHEINKILYFTSKQLPFQQQYAKTIRSYQTHQFTEALESFDLLPMKFKTTRDMLMLRIQIAKATNRNAYREALVLLENKFSSEADLGLLLADHYFFTKQYPKAYKAIDSFGHYIGGDIALDNLKVKLNLTQNNYHDAIDIGVAAIKHDSSYEDIYWLMLKAYLHSYNYNQVGGVLTVLMDKFNADIDIDTFYKESFYREYGFSKQFKKWKQTRIASK